MGVAPESVCSGVAILADINRVGSTVTDVAREVGVPRNRMSEALHGKRSLPASWLERLPIPVLAPLVARLAERCGLGVCELPSADAVTSDVKTLADVVCECADVARLYADALRDGYLTANEATELERECEEAIRALLKVRTRARAAKRERVIGVAV